MSKDIRIEVGKARSTAVGSEHGVSPADLRLLGPALNKGHRALTRGRKNEEYGFYDLYKQKAMFDKVKHEANRLGSRGYENLVILGIGGSALGVKALASALKPPYYNLLTSSERGGRPRLFVMDNVDPDSFGQMLALCPPESTLFSVVSKSGKTVEIVSQLYVVLDKLKKALGDHALKDHLVVTTGPPKRGEPPNPLLEVKREYRLRGFSVPRNVGGRFSVFSPVGLFPAAMLGIDIDRLAAGCRAMDVRCRSAKPSQNPAYLRAAFQYLACAQKGKSISVFMPYADCLRDTAEWYCQLWGESLGKLRREGNSNAGLPTGQTPLRALGVTDQHSQLQLYLEGPNDKIITVVETKSFERKVTVPKTLPGRGEFDHITGKGMDRLLTSECNATVDALIDAKRPVMRIALRKINEETIAQLLYMLEVETAMAGELFDVNTFDQPAVEQIKILTRQYMAKRR